MLQAAYIVLVQLLHEVQHGEQGDQAPVNLTDELLLFFDGRRGEGRLSSQLGVSDSVVASS